MKIVGLTGGIGSGKTTVAKMFGELGVPVYIADLEARELTNRSKVIRRKIIALFGEQSYGDNGLDRKYIADIVFSHPDLLKKLNEIIHPKVAKHFKRWVKKQEGSYCIKEAAILFENDGYKQCDLNILVVAPKEERIRRVLERDGASRREIEARMAHQWDDDTKGKLADIIIENIDLKSTREQVLQIHETLIK